MFGSPLSKYQQTLKGKRPSDMTVDQLQEWIDACGIMEDWVKAPPARGAWTRSRKDAELELARRATKPR